jgi:hypothetical protein
MKHIMMMCIVAGLMTVMTGISAVPASADVCVFSVDESCV